MLKEKFKKYSQWVLILTFAYVFSKILTAEIFINKSPRIRPQLGSYLSKRMKQYPGELIALITGRAQKEREIALQQIRDELKQLESVAFTQIAPGVKVRADEYNSETSYDINGVKWVKHKAIVDGVEYEYGWPEGQELPPQSMLDNMFR